MVISNKMLVTALTAASPEILAALALSGILDDNEPFERLSSQVADSWTNRTRRDRIR
jgi:hypothetical protein